MKFRLPRTGNLDVSDAPGAQRVVDEHPDRGRLSLGERHDLKIRRVRQGGEGADDVRSDAAFVDHQMIDGHPRTKEQAGSSIRQSGPAARIGALVAAGDMEGINMEADRSPHERMDAQVQ